MSTTNLTIHELGPKGDGIHCGARGRVYLERTVPGDEVRTRVYKDEDGIARGDVLEISKKSQYRQDAPCAHYDRCGNCSLQHLQLDYYRYWKAEMVKDAFRKQGLNPKKWLPPIYLGSGNRRRATFSAYKANGKIGMGYYRRRSKEIVDIETCSVADPKILELRNHIKPYLKTILQNGNSIDIFLQLVGNAVDMLVTGPVGKSGEADALVRDLLQQLGKEAGITRISWRAHEKEKIHPIVTLGNVVATFGELNVPLPSAAFLQPTVSGEQALTKAVMAALPSKGRFADLFSGCGTFSGPMLSRGSVDAYEFTPSAVQALTKASGKAPLKAFRRDLFRNPLRREEINRYDAIVFDPPRGGCPEQAAQMATAKTGLLVGVSCNPATFARDARLLCDGGYWLQSLQMVDQFQWSHHVEVVGVFTKKKRR